VDADTKQIAKQRVQTLFKLAKDMIQDSPTLAERYVETARKIAMSAKSDYRPKADCKSADTAKASSCLESTARLDFGIDENLTS